MLCEIKSWMTGKVLHAVEVSDDQALIATKLTLEAGIKLGLSFTGADLTRANLTGADLTGADLTRANLTGADLTGADLTCANLARANLTGADLTRANLARANLTGADLTRANLTRAKNLTLPTGETFAEYCSTIVPALCTAAGKSLEAVAATWNCHQWSNCPMHFAFFGFDGNFDSPEFDEAKDDQDRAHLTQLVKLYRPRIDQFVQLFDSGQLPCPIPQEGQQCAVGTT